MHHGRIDVQDLRISNARVVPVGTTAGAQLGLFDKRRRALLARPVDAASGLLVRPARRRRVLGLRVRLVDLGVVLVLVALGSVAG